MNISIAARVGIGFVTQLVLLVLCGTAGIIAVDKVSESVLFISGKAMIASQEGLKTSINLQSEMLFIERVLSNGIPREESEDLLEAYQQQSRASLDQVKASGLIGSELLDKTHKGILNYRDISSEVVSGYIMLRQQKGDIKHLVDNTVLATEGIKDQLDKLADSDDVFIPYARIASIFENLEQFRLELILSNRTLAEIFSAEDLYQQLTAIRQSRQRLKQDAEKTLKSLSVPALKEYKHLVEQYYLHFDQRAEQLVQDYRAFIEQRQQLSVSIDRLLALLRDMEIASAKQIDTEVFRVDALVSRSSSLMLTTVVAGVLMAIAAIVVLFLTVVKPIRIVARNLQQIGEGEGDLSATLKESGASELATLAKGFNAFVHKIQVTVSGVIHSVEELRMSATRLSQISNIAAQAIQVQSAETEQAAAALNEMAATANIVSEHTHQAAKAASSADQLAEQGGQNVGATIEAIQQQMSELNKAAQVVEQLANDSDGISNVLVVVDEIAEQTNLLALNAAIEAALAGEAGRGFAVVADEVRQLAGRTQTATTEIQFVVKNLRNSALEAVSAMQNSISAAGKSLEMAQYSGQSLSAITHESKTISDMNLQIASAAEQQAAVSEDINQNVISISERARDTQMASDEIQQATDQLSELAQRLGDLVKGFKY